jgi:plastocyanin
LSRRPLIALLACLGAIAAMTVLGSSAGARGSFTVKLDDDFFAPSSKTVSKGTKVKFKWVGNDDHSVAKRSGPGGSFNSGLTDERGVNFTKKFKKVGTYKLICTIHDQMKMTLKVK